MLLESRPVTARVLVQSCFVSALLGDQGIGRKYLEQLSAVDRVKQACVADICWLVPTCQNIRDARQVLEKQTPCV